MVAKIGLGSPGNGSERGVDLATDGISELTFVANNRLNRLKGWQPLLHANNVKSSLVLKQ